MEQVACPETRLLLHHGECVKSMRNCASMMTTVRWKWAAWLVVKILQTIAWRGTDIADMLCGAGLTVNDTIPTQPCMKVLQTRQVESEEGKR